MAKLIRKCRLADSSHRDVDLRIYEDIIIETIGALKLSARRCLYSSCILTRLRFVVE